MLLHILVHGFFAPLPMTIVVKNEDAANRQLRKQMQQFMAGGFIPVGVQPQD